MLHDYPLTPPQRMDLTCRNKRLSHLWTAPGVNQTVSRCMPQLFTRYFHTFSQTKKVWSWNSRLYWASSATSRPQRLLLRADDVLQLGFESPPHHTPPLPSIPSILIPWCSDYRKLWIWPQFVCKSVSTRIKRGMQQTSCRYWTVLTRLEWSKSLILRP